MFVVRVKSLETALSCSYLGQKHPYTELSLNTTSAELAGPSPAPESRWGTDKHTLPSLTFPQLLKYCWSKNHLCSRKASEINAAKERMLASRNVTKIQRARDILSNF